MNFFFLSNFTLPHRSSFHILSPPPQSPFHLIHFYHHHLLLAVSPSISPSLPYHNRLTPTAITTNSIPHPRLLFGVIWKRDGGRMEILYYAKTEKNSEGATHYVSQNKMRGVTRRMGLMFNMISRGLVRPDRHASHFADHQPF